MSAGKVELAQHFRISCLLVKLSLLLSRSWQVGRGIHSCCGWRPLPSSAPSTKSRLVPFSFFHPSSSCMPEADMPLASNWRISSSGALASRVPHCLIEFDSRSHQPCKFSFPRLQLSASTPKPLIMQICPQLLACAGPPCRRREQVFGNGPRRMARASLENRT